jgi:two-component system NtrC family sensor kinase
MSSVYTAPDLCKKCYSCVRSCPTKAIEVHSGQAHIIEEYCITCGLCVTMCSQGAKKIRSGIEGVLPALVPAHKTRCFAMLAPSFPAAFLNLEPGRVVGAVRALGFDGVFEVAFGADLVSYHYFRRFRELLAGDPDGFVISSPCPSLVFFIEKIHPELAPFLAGIASPMEAMGRVIRETVERDCRIVFIGPCSAKKDEAARSRAVDDVLTFAELVSLFEEKGVNPADAAPSDFDEPRANLGRIYPVTGGLLKAAAIDDDLLDSAVTVVEGPERIKDILNVLSTRIRNGKKASYRFYDLLFCEGCIGGPVMMNNLTFYERKKFIVQYIKNRPLISDIAEWAACHQRYLDIDLSVGFNPVRREVDQPPEEEIRGILAMTGKHSRGDELNCGACGYSSCREKAVAVYRGIAEVEMCLPYLISKIEKTVEDLRENQARLIQAEKLASMGQMAAGIAHEINNPLGVVLMYSHLLREELQDRAESTEDVERIIHEAERTRDIVRGILNFAREEKIDRRPTDINALVGKSLNGILKGFTGARYDVELNLDERIGTQNVDPNQLQQVFDNIIKNACEAMPGGGDISIRTSREEEGFAVSIADTGPGIAAENLPRLFSPFFTTKPVGKGTGLGLPVCYGIVKMHGGSIEAANGAGGGCVFTVRIKSCLDNAEERRGNRQPAKGGLSAGGAATAEKTGALPPIQ